MPWASGVLRGSGCLPAEAEKETSEIASADASQRELRFMGRCLPARGKAVKCEREPARLSREGASRLYQWWYRMLADFGVDKTHLVTEPRVGQAMKPWQ